MAAGSLTSFPLGERAHQVQWSCLEPLRICILSISKNNSKHFQIAAEPNSAAGTCAAL